MTTVTIIAGIQFHWRHERPRFTGDDWWTCEVFRIEDGQPDVVARGKVRKGLGGADYYARASSSGMGRVEELGRHPDADEGKAAVEQYVSRYWRELNGLA